jgi:hypothetical protein
LSPKASLPAELPDEHLLTFFLHPLVGARPSAAAGHGDPAHDERAQTQGGVQASRYVIVAIFILAAVITPPDFISQLGVAVP